MAIFRWRVMAKSSSRQSVLGVNDGGAAPVLSIRNICNNYGLTELMGIVGRVSKPLRAWISRAEERSGPWRKRQASWFDLREDWLDRRTAMTTTHVLFIQGGGAGAHDVDARLAESLQHALGHGYDVCFPRMPDEADPAVESWKREISAQLSHLHGKIVLVAHSVGGSLLLRYLSEERVDRLIAGLFLLAAPSWDEDRWNFDDLKLLPDIADRLSSIPRIFLYHSRDDEDVPFAHLTLHAARLPTAIVREVASGGHQFGNDLTDVARDIRAKDDEHVGVSQKN
jgi:predicted alpha/beta hydrolase family esterase